MNASLNAACSCILVRDNSENGSTAMCDTGSGYSEGGREGLHAVSSQHGTQSGRLPSVVRRAARCGDCAVLGVAEMLRGRAQRTLAQPAVYAHAHPRRGLDDTLVRGGANEEAPGTLGPAPAQHSTACRSPAGRCRRVAFALELAVLTRSVQEVRSRRAC